MPIAIRRVTPEGQKNEDVAWLCDDEWSLAPQIETLTEWITKEIQNISKAEYIADIGFCWRKNAGGGGSSISPEILKLMGSANMHLFFSEYPGFVNESEETEQGAAANP
jgi:hypothetical protein